MYFQKNSITYLEEIGCIQLINLYSIDKSVIFLEYILVDKKGCPKKQP